LDSNLG
jgi:hypothetical protein